MQNYFYNGTGAVVTREAEELLEVIGSDTKTQVPTNATVQKIKQDVDEFKESTPTITVVDGVPILNY